MSVRTSIAQRLSRAEGQPVVRVSRSRALIGARSLTLYTPSAEGSGLHTLAMRQLENARVWIEPHGEGNTHHAVRVSTLPSNEPLVVTPTREQADEIVRQIFKAVSPSRKKYVWITLLALVGIVILTPKPNPVGVPPGALGAYNPQRNFAPQIVTPQGMAAALPPHTATAPVVQPAPAAVPAPTPAQAPATRTDVNDPFGLQITPKTP